MKIDFFQYSDLPDDGSLDQERAAGEQ